MEIEGKAKELHGKAQHATAKAGERLKGAVEEQAGSAKNAVGHLIDNQQMMAEGKLTELKGKARQKVNQ